jgi:hypothetical protein
VRPAAQSGVDSGVDAVRIGLQDRLPRSVEDGPLLAGGVPEADAPRQAVDGKTDRTEQFGEGAARDAEQHLELEGAILAVTEADAEAGVGLGLGLDAGDAPAVAVDADGGVQAAHGPRTPRDGQTPPEGQPQEEAEQVQAITPGSETGPTQ